MSAQQSQIPSGVVNLGDYERLALERLSPNALEYICGGAADELTLRWNREAFDAIAIQPRVLRGGNSIDTSLNLLGRRLAHPIIVAPVAYQQLAHPDGECGSATAAASQEAGFVLSTLSTQTLETVAGVAPPRRWMQLYLQPDRDATMHLVRRAEVAGYEALVLTVDAPVGGTRDRERRVGFALPPGLIPANVGVNALPNLPGGAGLPLDQSMAFAPTWKDVDWLVAESRLPVILKGILDPDDAELAIVHGAAGIVVSNHGGRTLDTLPATIDALPAVAARVAGRIPVLVDGGIRRGTDIFKAIASGANAVLVGRPVVYGLTVAGSAGAADVLRVLREEFAVAMALTGCSKLAEISPRHLVRR
jgi:4-hydroxymandelate oxidase